MHCGPADAINNFIHSCHVTLIPLLYKKEMVSTTLKLLKGQQLIWHWPESKLLFNYAMLLENEPVELADALGVGVDGSIAAVDPDATVIDAAPAVSDWRLGCSTPLVIDADVVETATVEVVEVEGQSEEKHSINGNNDTVPFSECW